MAVMNGLERKIHQQFSEYGRNAKDWMRKCELLLPEIDRRQIWRKKRFTSIYEYAAKIVGMSKTRVDDSLRIYKKIENKPSLLELAQRKGLQSVRPVAVIATDETEGFWAKKAGSMSKLALQTYVHDYRLESCSGTEVQSVKLQMELEPKLAAQLEKLRGTGSWNELMKHLVQGQEKNTPPESVKTHSRHIPKLIRDHVEYRTSGLCAAPNCTRPATSLHHTQRWALEKVHDPARLQPMCTGHERIAHLGFIDHEEGDPQTWKLRKEPDKTHPKFFIDSMVALYRPT